MIKNIFLMLIISTLLGCKPNNQFDVQVSNEINENDITINFFETSLKQIKPIYKNGKKNEEIPLVYGENEWMISYKDSLTLEFTHFKTNRNDKHEYFFKFYKQDGVVWADVNILGIDEFKKTMKLK